MPEQTLKYTVIKSKAQYKDYTKKLEQLDKMERPTALVRDEIELLSLLIETWDREHNTFDDVDPVALIKGLLQEKGLKPADLAKASQLSKGLISDILNYKKGMSKEVIRFFASFFKLSQEILNRPYPLKQSSATAQRSQIKPATSRQQKEGLKKSTPAKRKQYA